MSTDLAGALRRLKLEKRIARLAPRPRDALLQWDALQAHPPLALVLDTNVYIHRAAGRLTPALQAMIDGALLFHSATALAELATGVANADPTHPRWHAVREHYTGLFALLPPTRILSAASQTWIEAGVITGTLARTQGFQPHQRKEYLNDSLIYLTAAKAGLPVLTANRDDFDLIQQVVSGGVFIHYQA